MAKSEIKKCLIEIDIFDVPELFALKGVEKLIFLFCVMQGAKNNLGIFKMHRGRMSMWLGVTDEEIFEFFKKHNKLIQFDEDTHTIWVKDIYKYVDFGLNCSLEKQIKDKNKGKKIVKNLSGLFTKNKFISKINAEFREGGFGNFKKSWINHNLLLLQKINEEVKIIDGNKYNLDKLLHDNF